ncbi:diguanylate cyclase [Thiohalorhabdus methylotrophus]|uniref:diguanylate cyclase n=1 Tax=Thiohalorhabdus methylotrophus TaxID=3242694 RepID=A0ABV4TV01_9GAMM
MDSAPFAEAASELRHQFTNLLESLSALRSLIDLDPQANDEETLLDQALHTLAEYQDLERSSVFLLQGRELINYSGLSREETAPDNPGFPEGSPSRGTTAYSADSGLMGLAVQTGQLQHCSNCAEDTRFRSWDGDNSVGSLICTPIFHLGQPLGVLNVSHPAPEAFAPWHEHLLQVFSTMLGYMLANHRLVHAMEAHVQERTMELEEALGEAERLKRRFEQLAIIDDLTRIHNRRFLFSAAAAEIAKAQRYRIPLSLMLLDLDHFKTVNDQYGHAAGDRVLKEIAAYFREQTREGDILARMGGEEFVLVLPGTGTEGAQCLGERIRRDIRSFQWQSEDGREFSISVSVGLTVLSPGDLPDLDSHYLLERMLAEADKAVYRCKAAGRDQMDTQDLDNDPG